MTQFATALHTDTMTQYFIARATLPCGYSTEELNHVERICLREINDHIEYHKEECHVDVTPYPRHSCELSEADPSGWAGWAHVRHITVSNFAYEVSRTTICYNQKHDYAIRFYYSVKLVVTSKVKETDVCDFCGTGTGPCKEEPTSNVAVEAIIKEMAVLSGAMTELEQDMVALVRKLKDIE